MLLACIQHSSFGNMGWRVNSLGFGVNLGFRCSVICSVFVHGAAESVETLICVLFQMS